MGMFGLKLRTNIPCADVIKILRQFDPDASISNLRFKLYTTILFMFVTALMKMELSPC